MPGRVRLGFWKNDPESLLSVPDFVTIGDSKMKKTLLYSLKIIPLILLCLICGCQMQRKKEGATTASPGLSAVLASLAPKEWKIYDQVRQFTPETLYEQINGHAEFFLAYNIMGMTFVSFDKSADKERFIDLSVYDMGTAVNAFGVFSRERSGERHRVDLGREAYRSGANYYIWKGPYYIQIVASDSSAELQNLGLELGRKVTDFLADSGEPVWGLKALPPRDRVPESVQYFLVDAMGLDFLKNTFTAEYSKGGIKVTAFLTKQDSREFALATVAKYIKHANNYGRGVKRLAKEGAELAICDMSGSYDVVFQKGRLVGGVTLVKDLDLAIHAAADLWKQLPDE